MVAMQCDSIGLNFHRYYWGGRGDGIGVLKISSPKILDFQKNNEFSNGKINYKKIKLFFYRFNMLTQTRALKIVTTKLSKV